MCGCGSNCLRKIFILLFSSFFVLSCSPKSIADNLSVPPLGPWTHEKDSAALNVKGAFENIVYDEITGKYWWLFDDRTVIPHVIRLAYSTEISGPYIPDVVIMREEGHGLDSCWLGRIGGMWYLMYERYDEIMHGPCNAYLAKSFFVNGPYLSLGIHNPIISHSINQIDFDYYRVSEFYVVEDKGLYYCFYMGQCESNGLEKVGVAMANNMEGPWNKWENNPIFAKSLDEWDSGMVKAADPIVYKFDDKWYVLYAASRRNGVDISYGLFESNNLLTGWEPFEKNPVITHGVNGFDNYDLGRPGGLIRVKDKYYLSYSSFTDAQIQVGEIATAPAIGEKIVER